MFFSPACSVARPGVQSGAMTTPSRALLAPLAFALLGATLPGCTNFAAPEIRVVDARVAEQSPQGVSIAFVMEGANSNSEEIPLQLVRYTLDVDGRRVFSGERMAEATLRRFGTQTFILPVAVPWDDLPERSPDEGARRYRLAGSLQYIAPGALAEVFFDTGVRRPSVRFAAEGDLTFTAPPPEDQPPVDQPPVDQPDAPAAPPASAR